MLKDRLLNEIDEYIRKNLIKIRDSGVELGNEYVIRFLAQGEYNVNFIISSTYIFEQNDDYCKKNIGRNNQRTKNQSTKKQESESSERCEGKKYVLRINTGSQIESDNQIKYEFDAISYLEQSGVTPKVYYLDDTKSEIEYGLLIMEFLPGRHLDYYNDMEKAGELIAKVHRVPIVGAGSFIVEEKIFSDRIAEGTRLLKDVWESKRISGDVKLFFEKFLNWAIENEKNQKYFLDNPWMVINNTELNSGNFLINAEGKSYIIDWEKPVISDPCQDITQFLAKTTTLWKTDYILNEDDEQKFYNSYIKTLGEDKDIKERVRLYTPYLYLRALSWCAYAYLEYTKEEGRDIKNMDTFRTIESFIQLDFMKELLSPYFSSTI